VAAWAIFLGVVLVLLAVDLFVLHRKPHVISMREALIGASIPALIALLFAGAIYILYQYHFFHLGVIPPDVKPHERQMWPDTGNEAVLMYLTGYIIEISLSADNVFLFVVLMTYFSVPKLYQHRVLFWGVLGALIMRAGMIIGGAALIRQFSWIILVFGGFLLFTGIKMLFSGDKEPEPDKSFAVRLARKFLRVTPDFHGKSFFVRVTAPPPAADSPAGTSSDDTLAYTSKEGLIPEATKKMPAGLYATPLFLVLICVEVTDVIFAVDSIPAIFAVTYDPFIIFTSNIFAILGLRSLYFLLAGSVDKFHLLKYGLAIVLTFVGVKMLLPWVGALYGKWMGHPEGYEWHIPIPVSLAVIVVVLLGSIILSLAYPKPHAKKEEPEEIHDEDDKPGKLV
jgi:tellurite resistance protein TerC